MKNNREEQLGHIFFEIYNKAKQASKTFEALQYRHVDLKNSMKEDRDNFFEEEIIRSEELVNKFGFFFLNGFSMDQEEIPRGHLHVGFQKGVIRTNCVDCLDRTNLMQNLISERAFYTQLRKCLRLSDSVDLDINSKVMDFFQEMWKNLGDFIAMQYGGSKAHQQKDSKLIAKILTAANRHISNNFWDMQRQKNISLFLGEFIPQEGGLDIWNINPNNIYEPTEAILESSYTENTAVDFFEDKLTIPASKKLSGKTFLLNSKLVAQKATDYPYAHILTCTMDYRLQPMLLQAEQSNVIQGHDEYDINNVQLSKTGDENTKIYDGFHSKNQLLISKTLAQINSYTEPEVLAQYLVTESTLEDKDREQRVSELRKAYYQDYNEDELFAFISKENQEGLVDSDILEMNNNGYAQVSQILNPSR